MVPPHKKRKKEGKESFIPLRQKKLCSKCDTCDSKKCKILVTYARVQACERMKCPIPSSSDAMVICGDGGLAEGKE